MSLARTSPATVHAVSKALRQKRNLLRTNESLRFGLNSKLLTQKSRKGRPGSFNVKYTGSNACAAEFRIQSSELRSDKKKALTNLAAAKAKEQTWDGLLFLGGGLLGLLHFFSLGVVALCHRCCLLHKGACIILCRLAAKKEHVHIDLLSRLSQQRKRYRFSRACSASKLTVRDKQIVSHARCGFDR
jgi:hypothetical protein